MKAPLEDDVWTRRGINVLWDGAALTRIGPVAAAISLRRFFTLDALGWPEDETPLVDDQALVVAGLDVALDALDPADIEAWIEQALYPRIQEFQSVFAGHRALIFWMPDKGRWLENSGEGAFEWRLGSGDQGPRLPLARLLWDGAYRDVQAHRGAWGQGCGALDWALSGADLLIAAVGSIWRLGKTFACKCHSGSNKMLFHVIFEAAEDGWIVAECPALPGCVSQGRDQAEAMEAIKEAIVAWLWAEDQKAISQLPQAQGQAQMLVAV